MGGPAEKNLAPIIFIEVFQAVCQIDGVPDNRVIEALPGACIAGHHPAGVQAYPQAKRRYVSGPPGFP